MGEWKRVKLGEICSKIGSGATPTGGKSAYKDDGVSLIRSQNVLDMSFAMTGLAHIDDEQARKLDGVTVCGGDVLLNITGDSVARCCIAPNHVLPARVNQHVCIVRPRPDLAESRFVEYFLVAIKDRLLTLASAGATRNALTKETIQNLEVPLPSLPTQRRIAAVLGALDDKIEVNRKICENLEAQSQALFKAWFVDFEPFGGKRPEGWKEASLLDVVELFDMKRIPLSSREREKRKGQFPYYGATSIMDYVDDYLFDGVYLLMGEDGSVAREDGIPYLQYISGKFWVNNHAHIMQGRNGYSTEMLWCALSQTDISTFVTGAVQPKLSQTNMQMIKVPILAMGEMRRFGKSVQPMFDLLRTKRAESRALAAMRDALLPKLMSGELAVEKVEG